MKINKEKLTQLKGLVESINLSKSKEVLRFEDNKLIGDRRYISYVLDTLGLGKINESNVKENYPDVKYVEGDMTYTLSRSTRGDYFLTRDFLEAELDRTTTRVILLRKSTKRKLEAVENKTDRTVRNLVRSLNRERRGFGL